MTSHHYVPQWHQKLFFNDNESLYWVLELPFIKYPSKDWCQENPKKRGSKPTFERGGLYNYMGHRDIDIFEKKFFGNLDTLGKESFCEWFKSKKDSPKYPPFQVEKTQDFLTYLTILYFRNPKVLKETQVLLGTNDNNAILNEVACAQDNLLLRFFESYIDIYDASQSKHKFIMSDNPVIFHNPAISLNTIFSSFQTATQIIVPLSKDYCLVASNLEYAEDPSIGTYFTQRKNARIRDNVLYRSDMLANIEEASDDLIIALNTLQKKNADETISCCNKYDLYPEKLKTFSSSQITHLLKSRKIGKSGTTFSLDKNGKVQYVQDQYGQKTATKEEVENMEDLMKDFKSGKFFKKTKN